MTPQRRIKKLIWDNGDLDDAATRYFNAPSEIDADGDIWIQRPGRGHWADNRQLTEFADYIDDQL